MKKHLKTMPKEGLQKMLIYEPVLARNGKRVAWLVALKGIWGAPGGDADTHTHRGKWCALQRQWCCIW